MTTYVSNAFALSMIPDGATIRTRLVDLPAIAHKLSNPISVVGHADTARVFSDLLGIPVEQNRVSISLTPTDTLYVGQVVGGRLPEGATTLPEGTTIKWICVRIDAEPQPYNTPIGRGSIYAGIVAAGEQIAGMFPHVQASVKKMADPWGNLIVEIEGHGLHATLWDD